MAMGISVAELKESYNNSRPMVLSDWTVADTSSAIVSSFFINASLSVTATRSAIQAMGSHVNWQATEIEEQMARRKWRTERALAVEVALCVSAAKELRRCVAKADHKVVRLVRAGNK